MIKIKFKNLPSCPGQQQICQTPHQGTTSGNPFPPVRVTDRPHSEKKMTIRQKEKTK